MYRLTLLFVILFCSQSVAVDWLHLPNDPMQSAVHYARAKCHPQQLPQSFDEDPGDADGAVASAWNHTGSAEGAIATLPYQQVYADRTEYRLAASVSYEAEATADLQNPAAWAETGATCRRVEVYQAQQAGVMYGYIDADALQNINVPENVGFLNLEVRVGKSVVVFEYYGDGFGDKWVLDSLMLWRVNAQGQEELIDLSWLKIESEGFSSLTGDPFFCSENVTQGEKVNIEVAINSTPANKLRAEGTIEGGPGNEFDAGEMMVGIVGALVSER